MQSFNLKFADSIANPPLLLLLLLLSLLFALAKQLFVGACPLWGASPFHGRNSTQVSFALQAMRYYYYHYYYYSVQISSANETR